MLAIVQGLAEAAELGVKEHDRLEMGRQMMARKLVGRRALSKLPELIELVIAKPLVSAGLVVKTLEVTPQAARRIVGELGLSKMTGRGRFRAWDVILIANDSFLRLTILSGREIVEKKADFFSSLEFTDGIFTVVEDDLHSTFRAKICQLFQSSLKFPPTAVAPMWFLFMV